ncbi:MAG: MoaD/ThiS family protein [Bacillota bacterium]
MLGSVRVEVGILLSRHSKYFEGGGTWVMLSVSPETTVSDIVKTLCIPPGYVSFSSVNGDKVDFSWNVRPGDEIVLFPYVVGGRHPGRRDPALERAGLLPGPNHQGINENIA